MSLPKVVKNNILLKKIEIQKKDKEIIILTPAYNERYCYQIIDIGNKVDIEINVSDIVFIHDYCGTEVKYEEISYIVVNEDNILAILPKE